MKGDLDTALRTYVREASNVLAKLAAGTSLPSIEHKTWERGSDGSFRRSRVDKAATYILLHKNEEELKALPSYTECVQALRTEPNIGPQLDKLVGGEGLGQHRIDADGLIQSLVYSMVDNAGRVEYSDQRFDVQWQRISGLLFAEAIPYVIVAPLPHFPRSTLPIELDAGLVIDSLSDNEMNRCLKTGIVQPMIPEFPLVGPEYAVGIRFETLARKVAYGDADRPAPPPPELGKFGRRSVFGAAGIIDDVLSALRLLKAGNVWSPGYVSYSPVWLLDGATSFDSRPGSRHRAANYELDAADTPKLQELWQKLTGGLLEKKPFLDSALRRLNFSLDRFRADDELVDLMIAAESLFLGDVGSAAGRGELKFRLALRASKFVGHPNLDQRKVYELMRKAYDVRSEIVHSGELSKKTSDALPNKSLPHFSDSVEEVIRLGLRKAIDVASADNSFGAPSYWDGLLFP